MCVGVAHFQRMYHIVDEATVFSDRVLVLCVLVELTGPTENNECDKWNIGFT